MKFIIFCILLCILTKFSEASELSDSDVTCLTSNITCAHGEGKLMNPNGSTPECICNCDSSKYTGDLCQFNVTENPNLTNAIPENLCTIQNRCLNGGTCKAISETESNCICDEFNFHGEYCQFTNGCNAFPCQNGGTCSANGNDFTCQCMEGFTDPTCSTRDPCIADSIQCLNGGTCERLSNKHGKCICPEGWLGERCDIRKPCTSTNPCRNSGICNITPDGYDFVCACVAGFYGKTCDFRDPCVLDNITCNGRGTCERLTDTEATCKCNSEDFYGKNCETKRGGSNLCDTVFAGTCLNDGVCRADPLALGIKCICPLGYSGIYCESFDPCQLPENVCQNGGICTINDNPDITTCTCQPGFHGPTCEVYSACASYPCVNALSCEDIRTDYYCKCMEGWHGRQCTLSTATTRPKPELFNNFVDNYCKTKFLGKCANGATCISFGDREYECVCTSEFTGKDCTQRAFPISRNSLDDLVSYSEFSQGASLQVSPRRGNSMFYEPQYPVSRGRAIVSRQAVSSVPGGAAPNVPGGPCAPGTPCDLCITTHAGFCQNGGACNTATVTATFVECVCDALHDGPDCSNTIMFTSCTNNPCERGGVCSVYPNGTLKCDCPIPYLDPFCKDRDPCKDEAKDSCLNGGTCTRKSDMTHECACRVPFKGIQCEEEDLCLVDPGVCIDDLVPTQKCYPCEDFETCKKISVNQYSCDPKVAVTTTRPHGGNPVDIVFVYPKAARLNEQVTFKMRFPKSTINLNWFFEDRSYINIDAANCNNIPPLIGVAADWAPYLFCSFQRQFPSIQTYEINVTSTGIPAPTESGTITIYENCIPSVRIHNVGHQDDYKNIEVDEMYTPIPEYSRGSTVHAWATVYMDCEPQDRRVQICSVEFEWRVDDEEKIVLDGTGNDLTVNTDNLPSYGYHTIYVTASVTFNERNLDCTDNPYAQLTVTANVRDQGTFELIRSNPVAIIEGGYERVLDQSTSITLNGTKSYDPDDLANVHPLTFTWTCLTFTNLVGVAPMPFMPCGLRPGTLTPTPTVAILPGDLKTGRYTFQLEVTSTVPGGSRGRGRAFQDIVVARSRVPDYSITCIRNCENGYTWTNRENKVVLKCHCTKCNVGPGQWFVKVVFADLNNRNIQPAIDYFHEVEKSVVDPSIDESQVYIQIDPNPPQSVIDAFVTPTNPNPQLTLIVTCTVLVDLLPSRTYNS